MRFENRLEKGFSFLSFYFVLFLLFIFLFFASTTFPTIPFVHCRVVSICCFTVASCSLFEFHFICIMLGPACGITRSFSLFSSLSLGVCVCANSQLTYRTFELTTETVYSVCYCRAMTFRSEKRPNERQATQSLTIDKIVKNALQSEQCIGDNDNMPEQ